VRKNGVHITSPAEALYIPPLLLQTRKIITDIRRVGAGTYLQLYKGPSTDIYNQRGLVIEFF
jgi:hypothetical protein